MDYNTKINELQEKLGDRKNHLSNCNRIIELGKKLKENVNDYVFLKEELEKEIVTIESEIGRLQKEQNLYINDKWYALKIDNKFVGALSNITISILFILFNIVINIPVIILSLVCLPMSMSVPTKKQKRVKVDLPSLHLPF